MKKGVLLLTVAVVTSIALPARASAQDYCPQVVGMSICDSDEWDAWAQCAADDMYQMCMERDPKPPASECNADAHEVYLNVFDNEARNCNAVIAECSLQGGTFNWETFHCDIPPDPPPSGGGGGGGGAGGGDGSCEEGSLVTVEECEDECGGIADVEAGECDVADTFAPGVSGRRPKPGLPAARLRSDRASLVRVPLRRGGALQPFPKRSRALRPPPSSTPSSPGD